MRTGIFSLVVFILVVIFLSPVKLQGWGPGHSRMTEAAVSVLPDWQKKLVSAAGENLIRKYCHYPDRKDSPEVSPYIILIDKIQFHYLPRASPAENYRFFTAGASAYLGKILTCLKEGKTDEGLKYLGYLFHVLQDACHPGIHSLEGFNGLTWVQLGEIIQPPGNAHPLYSPQAVFQAIIDFDAAADFKVSLEKYQPELLGTTVPEIVFHLYQGYVKAVRTARAVAVPAAEKVYSGKKEEAIPYLLKAAESGARLCADLAYTCFCNSTGRVSEDDLAWLNRIDLTSLEPISVPLITSFPYRFTPLILGASLGRWRKVYPLELWVEENGKREKKKFEKGFSTGMVPVGYDLPAEVFSSVEVWAGIHATLGADDWDGNRLKAEPPAAFTMAIKLSGKTLWESKVLQKNSPAEKVKISLESGGRLEFVARDASGASVNHANQPVWAEPVLIRLNR